ncbi:MAG: hypothetical protein M0021_09735 [Clostridia bacterium]|nr:hypothetical protein [Clostridia bacterium]
MTVEWFEIETAKRNILSINFAKSAVGLSKFLAEDLKEKNATHIQIGYDDQREKLIVKPSKNGLKLLGSRKAGTVTLTKVLTAWLEEKNVKGKYELVYDEARGWYESK